MEIRRLDDMQTLVSLSKRRGFVFQSSEIYGGINACWDFGPLGVELKLNVKKAWWKAMTSRKDIEGLDAAILMHPQVWKASGHVDGFSDPLVDCKDCKARHRQDKLEDPTTCPNCGGKNLSDPRNFNLMFKTHMGPVEESGNVVYLRPETAQGIFVNFENVATSMRKKIPFGIAQIGKSFRNEITPGNFIFRTREFEQMEMQYFVKPGTDDEAFEEWKEIRKKFYSKIGLNPENLRFTPHGPDELAHYAKAAFDIEYKYPIGWSELEGIHNRSDFDLKQHQEFSGKSLEYFDEAAKEKYLPFVIETAVGCDRLVLACMSDAYREEISTLDNGKEDKRVVMGFHPDIAPVKAAILPLSKKEPLLEYADKVFADLNDNYNVQMDVAGSIGKRYRRQDEIGTPLCITVDFDTLEDHQVTVRHRDTMAQDRVAVDQLANYVFDKLRKF
ncbi:MAG: glycine--tRNA ligase [Bdellovibrionota bacterium]|nr:glycine--tRNA ligase [Bdellovibrionota bacterium]